MLFHAWIRMRGALHGLVMGLGLAIAGSIVTTILFEIFARVIHGESAALRLGEVEEAIWEFAFLSGLVLGPIVGWRRAAAKAKRTAWSTAGAPVAGLSSDAAPPVDSDLAKATERRPLLRNQLGGALHGLVGGIGIVATGCVSLVLALTVIYWLLGIEDLSGVGGVLGILIFPPAILLAIFIGPIIGWWKAAKRAKGTAQ